MKDKTKELIEACRKAGYEHLVVFCTDERVPQSVESKDAADKGMKKGQCYYYNQRNGHFVPRLICASPPQTEKPNGFGTPKIWGIVKDLGINPNGNGWGDCFPIHEAFTDDLDSGCYDLKEG